MPDLLAGAGGFSPPATGFGILNGLYLPIILENLGANKVVRLRTVFQRGQQQLALHVVLTRRGTLYPTQFLCRISASRHILNF